MLRDLRCDLQPGLIRVVKQSFWSLAMLQLIFFSFDPVFITAIAGGLAWARHKRRRRQLISGIYL